MFKSSFAVFTIVALLGCKTTGAGSQVAADESGIATQVATPAPDLSAVTITNFHPVDGKLYRGARPTSDQVAQLAAIGVKTILSLETYALEPWDGDDEQQAAANNGIQFVRVEMNPMPVPEPSIAQIKAAVAVLTKPDNQPAFVHCYHGSDRTGVTVGAYRIIADGWTPDQAIAEVEAYGHSSALYRFWDNQLYHLQ